MFHAAIRSMCAVVFVIHFFFIIIFITNQPSDIRCIIVYLGKVPRRFKKAENNNLVLMSRVVSSWMKNTIDMQQETNYYMPYSEMLDSCQGYQLWHQHEVTWEQGSIRALVSITLQRNLISTTSWGCPEHQCWPISGY